VKEYYKYRREYIKKEKGKIKISGDLFVGHAGTGKSVLLTAIPQMLGLPGYMLDVNAALGGLQGQSEQALRDAIAKAEKLAPCVLLMDEIEKMLAGTGEGEVAGNEVAEKLLGILLTAMAQDNGIYWIASANKVAHMPAPLKRKGRFDNIWYVGFPDIKTRAKILGIHCRLNDIDLTKLSDTEVTTICQEMEQWTGAEIRHIAKEASIKSIATGKRVGAEELMEELKKVIGISKDQKETKELADWAAKNALSVD
jgi:SpoVK/Ycf46/Vps4 family AAA+-type ATPase